MRILKRLAAALLTTALLASLIVVPTSAVQSSFSDISDQTTAVNADILRLMGVVSGTGGNRFNPDATLTRAQFCTMVVNFLQRQDEAARYATRTIFSDVKSDHWARSYVNLAASITFKDGENNVNMVSGVGNGKFLPDSKITMAEAVTILIRALQYTSQQAGAVWPQSYMDLAASIGLTDNLPATPGAHLNRGQAAQLFVNALKCKTGEGKPYYTTLGNVPQDKTIILAVNVETDDGSARGAIRTTANKDSEAYLPANGDGNPVSLQGKRGNLVLNDKDEIITFIPDDSTATTITLAGDAQAAYVKASGGQQYTISSKTPVYTSAAGQSKDYLDAYTSLVSGTQITMYTEKGKIVAIYSTSGATTASTQSVVVLDRATAETFYQLTGGVSNFNIVKNRQSIRLSDIKPYDVVTYDQMTNTLVVSDLRITAVYTDPKPTPKNPETITVVGNEFKVLESAWSTIGETRPGDSVSLLLTADGKVAGIVKSTPQTRSTAVGIVDGGKARMFLPNGTTMDLSGELSGGSGLDGQLVILSGMKNSFSASRLPENRAPGAFNVTGMKLGSYTVSTGVRLYERVSSGAMVSVSLGDLAMQEITADNIVSYRLNSSNVVDYIVLRDTTGNAYIYGMMVGGYESETEKIPVTGPDGQPKDDEYTTEVHEWYNWNFRNGTRKEVKFVRAATYSGKSGDMVGVVIGTPIGDANGEHTLRSVIKLTEIKGVKPSDFFDSQGIQYVTAQGQTYRIADNVECYYNRSGNKVAQENWLTGDSGASRLTAIKAYSDELTVYVDPIGKQVRVVAAK